MTTRAFRILKGWSIGVSASVVLGTVVFLTSAKSSEEKAMEGGYMEEIIQYNDTSMYEYPSLFDAEVITNIPLEEIREAIRTKKQIDGYYFRVKR
jgi:hypothetical protein